MYAYIRGTVDETSADRAIIEAGGVGYELFCSSMTLKTLTLGAQVKLYTHLHLAEGVQALYGFSDPEEREMFRKLLNVSRIGPKLAISVLSTLTPSDVPLEYGTLLGIAENRDGSVVPPRLTACPAWAAKRRSASFWSFPNRSVRKREALRRKKPTRISLPCPRCRARPSQR